MLRQHGRNKLLYGIMYVVTAPLRLHHSIVITPSTRPVLSRAVHLSMHCTKCAALPITNAGQYATSNCNPLLFWFPCKRQYKCNKLSFHLLLPLVIMMMIMIMTTTTTTTTFNNNNNNNNKAYKTCTDNRNLSLRRER